MEIIIDFSLKEAKNIKTKFHDSNDFVLRNKNDKHLDRIKIVINSFCYKEEK